MVNNFLYFLFDLFDFLNLLNKWKIILIDFRRCFYYTWYFLKLLKWIFLLDGVSFSEGFITYNTAFWNLWHEGTIRVDFFLHLNLFNDDLLLDDRFLWYQILRSVRVLDREDFGGDKWISNFLVLLLLEASVFVALVANFCNVLYEGEVFFIGHTENKLYHYYFYSS